MRKGLASVIIPVFNGESFVGEAIESVLAQDYEPVEIIVIDDGSTDRSAEVASSYEGVRVIEKDNEGQAAARNSGLDIAEGEFIGFLDADDVMLPDKLSTQIRYLQEDPDCACVLTRHEVVTDDAVEAPGWMQVQGTADAPEVQPLSAVIRRDALDRIGFFDASFKTSEDFDLLVRLKAAGVGIDTIDRVLLRRRMHGGNISYRVGQIQKEMLTSIKTKIDRARGARGGEDSDG